MRIDLVFGIALALLGGTAPAAQGSPRQGTVQTRADQAVIAAQSAWHRAYAANDSAALKRLLTEDAIIIESDGDRIDRAALLARGALPPIPLTLSASQQHVRRAGDAAVVTSVVIEKRGPARLEFRVTDVFVAESAGWKLASSHWTRTGGELIPVALDTAALDRLAGTYRTPRGGLLSLTRDSDGLRLSTSEGQITHFVPLSDTVIMAPTNRVRWLFITGEDGQVTHAVSSNQYTLVDLVRVGPPHAAPK